MCYNELRIRGFSKDLIAQTVGSSNNQWQVSQSVARAVQSPVK